MQYSQMIKYIIELLSKLKDYSAGLKESVQKKDAHLQEVGYKNYTK